MCGHCILWYGRDISATLASPDFLALSESFNDSVFALWRGWLGVEAVTGDAEMMDSVGARDRLVRASVGCP